MKRNVSKVMMLLSLTVILALVMPVMSHAQKANFAGTWTLNESKTTMPEGGGGRMMGTTFTVAQEANLLTQTRTGQDGTQRVTKYTLDGKESVNTSPRGDSKSVAAWSPDGKSLTIKTTSEYNGNTFTMTAVWSMSDAKTLTTATSFTGQDGTERKMTMVYDKK
jgi:predicted ATP-dependent Lon-type protease